MTDTVTPSTSPSTSTFIRGPHHAKDFMGTHMLTLHCSSPQCSVQVRIGRVLNTQRTPGAFRFCPTCGSPALAHTDTEETYWEALARSYSLPVDLIRMLYDEWDTREFHRFADFVAFMQADDAATPSETDHVTDHVNDHE